MPMSMATTSRDMDVWTVVPEPMRSRRAGLPRVECFEPSGVVEIHDPRLVRPGREAFCRALAEAAVMEFDAELVEIDLNAATCRLVFGAERFDRSAMADRAAGAIRAATPAVGTGGARGQADRPRWTDLAAFSRNGEACVVEWGIDPEDELVILPFDEEAIADAKASRRLRNLAMAGGSFLLAIGGMILPGIPTLPFLIMTAKYAVRVSPKVERILKSQPWLAAMIAEPESAEGRSIAWRSVFGMIAMAALFVAAIVILHPPLPIVLALELGLMAFLAWRELRDEAEALEPAFALAA
jgi:uncharacterized membrane protein YbaN (DUF454 family)